MRRPLAVIVLLLFAGCATYAIRNFDSRYGAARPKEEVAATGATVEYERDIRPLMEGRCLVCHGCYDAPCQLKLDSYEGVLRGAARYASIIRRAWSRMRLRVSSRTRKRQPTGALAASFPY